MPRSPREGNRAARRSSRRATRRKLIAAGVGVLVAAAAVAVLLAAFAGGDERAASRPGSPTTTTTTTTTTTAPPNAPLTGLPDASKESLGRPALSVKIENSPDARPQAGLEVADVVYEEAVEGGITRFLAMFNSTVPASIGPIRSVRAMDANIVWPVGGVFAYSGGAEVNVASIRASTANTVDETAARGAMFRTSRAAPHNLYGRTAELFAFGGKPVPPPALFEYLTANEIAVGEGVQSFRVGFINGYDPTYTWDATTKTWARSYGANPFVAESGARIAPTNVVVQFTPYLGDGEGQTVGEGEAWIFSDGVLRKGRWIRPSRDVAARYVDASGAPIRLRPGTTWVELLPSTSPVDVVAAPLPPPTTVATTTTTTRAPTTTRRR